MLLILYPYYYFVAIAIFFLELFIAFLPNILYIMHFILDIMTSMTYFISTIIKGGGLMTTWALGNRLKVARAEAELSQEELAGLVGVTRQTISAVETMQYCPSALLAFRIAQQLGKRVDEVFFLKGEETK
jgi:putative transcriptional regulator